MAKAEKLAAKEAEKAKVKAVEAWAEHGKAVEAAKPELVAEEEEDWEDDWEGDDDEEAAAVSVKKFTIKDKEYLIDEATKILYDTSSHDEVGIWDDESKTILEMV